MSDLNTAVAALLQAEGKKAKVRKAPKGKRKEVKRQQERSRMSIEVDPLLRKFMLYIAEREGCSPASVLKLWMAQGVIEWAKEESLGEYKQPTISPKWENIVVLGNLLNTLGYLRVLWFGK